MNSKAAGTAHGPSFWTTRSAQERELTAAGTHRTTSRRPSILGPEADRDGGQCGTRCMQFGQQRKGFVWAAKKQNSRLTIEKNIT